MDDTLYSTLGWVTQLLQRIPRSLGHGAAARRGVGGDPGSVRKITPGIEPAIGDLGSRIQLQRILARLDGSRDLVLELAGDEVLPPICIRAAEQRLTRATSCSLNCCARGSTASHRRGREARRLSRA